MRKLSELTAEQGIDALADIIPFIGSICMDKEVTSDFVQAIANRGTEEISWREFGSIMLKHSPKVLKSHKYDLIGILSALNGVSPEVYNTKLGFFKLSKDLISLFTDDEVAELFGFAQTGEDTETSASVLDNTKETTIEA